MSARRARAAALGVLAFAVAASAPAWSQSAPPGFFSAPQRPGVAPAPLIAAPQPSNESPRFTRPAPALTTAQSERLRRAMDLRHAGLPDRARDTLQALLREAPHHPLVVTELARAHVMRGDWSAIVTLGRAERLHSRDSLLVARELSLALERQGRVREAAQAVIEAWAASGREAFWAEQRVMQLSPGDGRGVAEALRDAVARRPGRADLAMAHATLLARTGRPADAAAALAAADRPESRPALRQRWADAALAERTAPDSAAAVEALVSLAGDTRCERPPRLSAARHAWGAILARGVRTAYAPRLAAALTDVPPSTWGADLLVDVARALREAGRAAESRALLERDPAIASGVPELALERLLARLREGPPEAVVPALDSLARRWTGAAFMLAEAEFFAHAWDSALVHYDAAARTNGSPDALAALERWYLLDEGRRDPAMGAVASQAYARWRGDAARARALADSLHRALPVGSPLAATAALAASDARAAARDWSGALAAALVVADSLAADRLAPLARQRAGELLLAMGDSRRALAQFEEGLARYPRAWNAPEMRRRVERLRKEARAGQPRPEVP